MSHPFPNQQVSPENDTAVSDFKTIFDWASANSVACKAHLEDMTKHPEAFWTSRAKRIAVQYAAVRSASQALLSDVNTMEPHLPPALPIARARENLAAVEKTATAIIEKAHHIAETGRSFKTMKADIPPLQRLPSLVNDIDRATVHSQALTAAIQLVAEDDQTSPIDIVHLSIAHDDALELVDLCAAYLTHWKTRPLTQPQQRTIETAEELIAMQRGLQEQISKFLKLAAYRASLTKP